MIRQNEKQPMTSGQRPGKQSVDNDLQELFLEQLGDIYNAEQQLIKALPKMAEFAESEQLREAIESHLTETQRHATRLEEAVSTLGKTMPRKTCAAMKGLIKEGEEMASDNKKKASLDAAIIAAAQKVEHYEVATYGSLRAWAEQLGHNDVAALLKETLAEEAAADEKLTSIAKTFANERAIQE